jgi:hypothetical protein
MADPITVVGLVSAAASLVDAVIGVFTRLSRYSLDVKAAPRHSEELRNEVDALFRLLPNLRDAIEAGIDETKKEDLRSDITQLETVLRSLMEKTSKVEGFKRLKWPFKETENARYISRIERFKTNFGLVMSVGNRYVALF